MGRFEEALARYEATLVPLEQRLGPQHPFLAMTIRACGNINMNMKRYKEALPYFQRARAVLESRQDDPYGNLTGTWLDLGRVWLELKQPRKAAEVLEQAVAGRPDSKQTAAEKAFSRFYLARALWDANLDRPRALRLAEEARELLVSMGERHAKPLAELDAWRARLPRPAGVPATSAR
jgi:tetratricopeptide (TPR) repeat protein